MPKIFDYKDIISYLKAYLAWCQARNPRYSLRSWCRSLGLKEAASLSLVMSGKRPLSNRVADRLKPKLCTTGDERDYFDIITCVATAHDPQTKLFYERLASDFAPLRSEVILRLEHFRLMSHWVHFALQEMTKLSDFSEDLEWLHQKLQGRVRKVDIRDALDRLLRLNYLQRNSDGRLVKTHRHLKTETEIPNATLRQMHLDYISMAIAALQEQDLARRDITAFHTSTSREKIPEAKRMIARFRQQLMEFLEEPHGETVYQVNVQMYDLLAPK